MGDHASWPITVSSTLNDWSSQCRSLYVGFVAKTSRMAATHASGSSSWM